MQKIVGDVLVLQGQIETIEVVGAVRTFIGGTSPELQWFNGTSWNVLIEEAPNDGGLYGRKSKDWIALNDSADPVTASNGITRDVNDLKLGGVLSANTDIDLNAKVLQLLSIFTNIIFDAEKGEISLSVTDELIESKIIIRDNSIILNYLENDVEVSKLQVDSTIYARATRFNFQDYKNSLYLGYNIAPNIPNAYKSNLFIGYRVGYALSNGTNSILLGNAPASLMNTIENCVAIGTAAIQGLSAGEAVDVVAIGVEAGKKYNGGGINLNKIYRSVIIGAYADPKGDNQTNQIVIGAYAVGNGNNTATIGDASITDLHAGTSSQAKVHASALKLKPSALPTLGVDDAGTIVCDSGDSNRMKSWDGTSWNNLY